MWALCINGLFVSKAKYSDPLWAQQNQFTISSLRVEGDRPGLKVIAQWNGPTAAQACEKTVPMLAAWGVIDMYACLEEFIFSLYKIFLNHNPETLLQDKAHKPLRKLWKESRIDKTKLPQWESAWGQRITDWQRKRVFDGLKAIFLAYFKHASLQKPSHYVDTTEAEWAETIEGIGYLRHALIHGATQVPKELGDFSKKQHAMNFNFIEGTPIIVELLHLQGIELFCDQLLTALNQSLAEKMIGKPLTAI